MRQVSGNTLQQVETFKYLGVVFTSEVKWSEEIDARVGKARSSSWVLSLCGHKTGAFKHCKAVTFKIVFLFRSVLMAVNPG